MKTNSFLNEYYRTETQLLDQFILWSEEIITDDFRKESALTERVTLQTFQLWQMDPRHGLEWTGKEKYLKKKKKKKVRGGEMRLNWMKRNKQFKLSYHVGTKESPVGLL